MQNKQLDLHVRFWDGSVVRTRYFDSAFLGHATAEHLLECVLAIVDRLELRKVCQISMDGPSVNWKFLSSFLRIWKQITDHRLLMLEVVVCTSSTGLFKKEQRYLDGALAVFCGCSKTHLLADRTTQQQLTPVSCR